MKENTKGKRLSGFLIQDKRYFILIILQTPVSTIIDQIKKIHQYQSLTILYFLCFSQ